MQYISLSTRTRLKRTLIVVGGLLFLWHLATACYLVTLDWQWQLTHDTYKPSLGMSFLNLAGIVLWGAIGLIVPLCALYEAFEERSLFNLSIVSRNGRYPAWQFLSILLLPVIIVGTIGIAYSEMLFTLSTDMKPTKAAEEAFQGYLGITVGSVVFLLCGSLLLAVLADIWKPDRARSNATHTPAYVRPSRTDKNDADSDTVRKIGLGLLLGWLFFS